MNSAGSSARSSYQPHFRFAKEEPTAKLRGMSTRELIEKEVSKLPEPLQREVYDFARFLRLKADEELFNGMLLSESALEKRLEHARGGRRVGKPVVGDIVVLPFPQTNL